MFDLGNLYSYTNLRNQLRLRRSGHYTTTRIQRRTSLTTRVNHGPILPVHMDAFLPQVFTTRASSQMDGEKYVHRVWSSTSIKLEQGEKG